MVALATPDWRLRRTRIFRLDRILEIRGLSEQVSKQREEVFAQRQERGQEYAPLVDLFNTLTDVIEYRDVVDNFTEFKLLVQYPKLTPYMYGFVEMKQEALKRIFEIANRDYVFRDINDFILSYFQPIHDNFNIQDSLIKGLIKRAEKKAKSNEMLNRIDEKLGRRKKHKLSLGAHIVHWLLYWPIFLFYIVFETCKLIFTQLPKMTIPILVISFVMANWKFPKMLGIENLLVFRKIISKKEWYEFVEGFLEETISNGFAGIMLSLIAIVLLLAIYILPSLFIAIFTKESTTLMAKHFDWNGMERTIKNMLQIIRDKTAEQYNNQKKTFYKRKLPKVVLNFMCLAVLIAIIIGVPIGLNYISEKTGYGQKTEHEEYVDISSFDTQQEVISKNDEETETEIVEEIEYIYYIVTVNAANIRAGAGTQYEIVSTAKYEDVFIGTGVELVGENGGTWYEIYLDEEMLNTGWASEVVIKKQE